MAHRLDTEKKKTTKKTKATKASPPVDEVSFNFRNLAQKTAKPKSKSNDKKIQIVLDGEIGEAFSKFVPTRDLVSILGTKEKQFRADFEDEVFIKYLDLVWNSEKKISSPQILVNNEKGNPDCSATFVVVEGFNLEIPDFDNDGDYDQQLVQALVRVGLDTESAEKLVEEEIDLTPKIFIKPFNVLAEGHYENKEFIPATDVERSAANKLMGFVQGDKNVKPLTAAERDAAMDSKPSLVVKPGFFVRATEYAENFKQYRAIFKIIKPRTPQIRTAKFAISDSEERKLFRQAEMVAEIIGVELYD